jgi:hypothetical protein
MDREQLVDRMGASAPPDSEKPVVNRTRTAGAKGPPAPSRWIRPIGSFDRRQPREYQVSRYG